MRSRQSKAAHRPPSPSPSLPARRACPEPNLDLCEILFFPCLRSPAGHRALDQRKLNSRFWGLEALDGLGTNKDEAMLSPMFCQRASFGDGWLVGDRTGPLLPVFFFSSLLV